MMLFDVHERKVHLKYNSITSYHRKNFTFRMLKCSFFEVKTNNMAVWLTIPSSYVIYHLYKSAYENLYFKSNFPKL